MSANRESVMSAVAALIQGVTFPAIVNGASTWNSFSQRLRLWGDVPADQQPAAFLVTHREIDEFRNLGVIRRRLELQIWCYARTDDQLAIGQTFLDSMLMGIEASFAPDDPSNNTLTLGGQVYWCRIEGRIFKDPGDIDNQAMMIIPLVVEMP